MHDGSTITELVEMVERGMGMTLEPAPVLIHISEVADYPVGALPVLGRREREGMFSYVDSFPKDSAKGRALEAILGLDEEDDMERDRR